MLINHIQQIGPYLAGGLTVAIWGATPAATAILAKEVPPELIGIARLLACAVVLVPIALALRPRLPSDRVGWIALLISAVVGFFGSFMLQGLGIPRTSTTHAALILTLPPIFTAIVQFILSRRWPGLLWWIGSATALVGVLTVILGRDLTHSGHPPTLIGDLIILAGSIPVSIGYVSGAKLSARIGLFSGITWSIILATAVSSPAAPALIGSFRQVTWIGFSALTFLALFCTLIGFAAWFWALEAGGVTSIAPLLSGQPVASLLIAATLLTEQVSTTALAALILICLGVYVSRRSPAMMK